MLLFVAAVAMLWIKPPAPEHQSEQMPLTVASRGSVRIDLT